MYLIIGKVIGHNEEKIGDKHLVFGFTDEKKGSIKKIRRTLGWD